MFLNLSKRVSTKTPTSHTCVIISTLSKYYLQKLTTFGERMIYIEDIVSELCSNRTLVRDLMCDSSSINNLVMVLWGCSRIGIYIESLFNGVGRSLVQIANIGSVRDFMKNEMNSNKNLANVIYNQIPHFHWSKFTDQELSLIASSFVRFYHQKPALISESDDRNHTVISSKMTNIVLTVFESLAKHLLSDISVDISSNNKIQENITRLHQLGRTELLSIMECLKYFPPGLDIITESCSILKSTPIQDLKQISVVVRCMAKVHHCDEDIIKTIDETLKKEFFNLTYDWAIQIIPNLFQIGYLFSYKKILYILELFYEKLKSSDINNDHWFRIIQCIHSISNEYLYKYPLNDQNDILKYIIEIGVILFDISDKRYKNVEDLCHILHGLARISSSISNNMLDTQLKDTVLNTQVGIEKLAVSIVRSMTEVNINICSPRGVSLAMYGMGALRILEKDLIYKFSTVILEGIKYKKLSLLDYTMILESYASLGLSTHTEVLQKIFEALNNQSEYLSDDQLFRQNMSLLLLNQCPTLFMMTFRRILTQCDITPRKKGYMGFLSCAMLYDLLGGFSWTNLSFYDIKKLNSVISFHHKEIQTGCSTSSNMHKDVLNAAPQISWRSEVACVPYLNDFLIDIVEDVSHN
eukprot:GHVL01035180.1.p1 GENE.GHVL01035180.1~~GHVL01035180.1.p1  ORF type:complete len:687 (-),score=126.61 GHVL01035180.1:351-2267(-)